MGDGWVLEISLLFVLGCDLIYCSGVFQSSQVFVIRRIRAFGAEGGGSLGGYFVI